MQYVPNVAVRKTAQKLEQEKLQQRRLYATCIGLFQSHYNPQKIAEQQELHAKFVQMD